MTWIRMILVVIVGLGAGFAVAAGVFALITTIGVVPRLIGKTHTANRVHQYEWCIILGGSLGNLWYLIQPSFEMGSWFGNFWLGLYGLFAGVFVGCLATALAEALDTTAIFTRRLKLTGGLGYLVLALALGKLSGSLWQFFFEMAKVD